jgi:hypothetical protein
MNNHERLICMMFPESLKAKFDKAKRIQQKHVMTEKPMLLICLSFWLKSSRLMTVNAKETQSKALY